MSRVGLRIFEEMLLPVQRLPLGFHYFCGRGLSWAARVLVRYRRDVVVQNLSRSFPGKGYKEIAKMTTGFYEHLGYLFAETMWFGGCRGRRDRLRRQRICEVQDSAVLSDAFNGSPSVMLLGSHFGNWELSGGLFEYFKEGEALPFGEDNICVVYKRQKSAFWDAFMADNRKCVRKEGFNGLLESSQVLRYAFSHKGERKIYVFFNDQYPYKSAKRHEIPSFMHQRTQAMEAAMILAHKMGMSVVHLSMDRERKGRYVMHFTEICRDASKMEPEAITKSYYELLEKDINSNPGNYLWSHKRWK